LLDLWRAQDSPVDGWVLKGRNGRPLNLDNTAKRKIRPLLASLKIEWPEWYALRRFHGTAVDEISNAALAADALRNTKAVAKRHYIKARGVKPELAAVVDKATAGLVN